MAGILSTALDAITTEFDALFNDIYTDTPVQYTKYAMTVKSNGSVMVHAYMEQTPGVREWTGARHIHDVSAVGYAITNKTWENTVAMKKADIEDDQVGVYAPMIRMLGYNAKTHPDVLVTDLMKNNGTCYDGASFFGNHTWRGETVTNTGALALDATNFEKTKAALRKLVATSGPNNEAPLLRNLTFQLVVGPDLEAAAQKIVEAEFDNFGATNVNKGRAELIVLDDLTGTYANYWFVFISNAPIKPFIFQERTGDELVSLTDPRDENVFMRREFLYGWERRYNAGYGFWQLAYRQTGGN